MFICDYNIYDNKNKFRNEPVKALLKTRQDNLFNSINEQFKLTLIKTVDVVSVYLTETKLAV